MLNRNHGCECRVVMLAALLAFFTIGGCSSSKPVDSGYAVTGTLSGYTGAGLVLAATGLPDLAVPFNAKSFSFSGLLPNGPSHTVTVAKQPTVGGIRCSILGGASKASGADENVVVTCAPERTIASGNDHNLALNANGSLLAWGAGSDGQLGDGSKGTKLAPEPIGNVFTWAFVSAGQGHSTALRTDGSLWAWGSNGDGQFGNGTTTGSSSPTSIGDEQDWAFVSAGSDHTLAVKTDGSLWAWGANGVGQLGNGTIQYSSTRIQIGKEYNWAFVSAGHRFSTALKKDGSLWAWGINLYGQVGDGTALSTVLAPVKIDGDHAWTLVSAGESHVAALQADGSLWTWGNNSSGQLGVVTAADFSGVPVRVGNANNWAFVSTGGSHTVAVDADGFLWTWGKNYSGQLGDGTQTDSAKPHRIGTDTDNDWDLVSAGSGHTIARRANGEIWAWGGNFNGELGDATTINRLTPTRVW